jgi:hypothetical protein
MADFGDYVTPRDLELAADRARRIRALAAHRVFDYLDEEPNERLVTSDYMIAIDQCARIIDALDALPVPERGK